MSLNHDAVEGRVETEEGRVDIAGTIGNLISFFKSLALAPITVPLDIFNFIIRRIPFIGRFFRPG
ncbi:unnamed protein product [Ixodes pacificus]